MRFVHQPTGTRRFGDDEYAEPWLAHRAFVTRGPEGARRLWAVFTHNLLFPSVLRELDPRDGTVRQEYWSNGYIETVREETWAGRPVVLVGGTNNDFRAASLAVFRPDGVAGSTPAVGPATPVATAPPAGPRPSSSSRPCASPGEAGRPASTSAWVEKGERRAG